MVVTVPSRLKNNFEHLLDCTYTVPTHSVGTYLMIQAPCYLQNWPIPLAAPCAHDQGSHPGTRASDPNSRNQPILANGYLTAYAVIHGDQGARQGHPATHHHNGLADNPSISCPVLSCPFPFLFFPFLPSPHGAAGPVARRCLTMHRTAGQVLTSALSGSKTSTCALWHTCVCCVIRRRNFATRS